MKNTILSLEKVAAALEPSEIERKKLLDCAWEYSNEFVKDIKNIKAYDNDYSGLSFLDEMNLDAPFGIWGALIWCGPMSCQWWWRAFCC